jgi:hypothetical protein
VTVYTLSYQMYKYEHGLAADERRAADVRAGEARTSSAASPERLPLPEQRAWATADLGNGGVTRLRIVAILPR